MRWRLTNRGKIFFSALAIIILTVILFAVIFSTNSGGRTFTVQSAENVEAYIYRQNTAFAATPGRVIQSGDRIEVRSGSGWVTITSADGISATLFQGSAAILQFTGKDSSGTFKTELSSGAALFNISKDLEGGYCQCVTKSSAVTGRSQSAFLVQVDTKTDFEETRLQTLMYSSELKVFSSKVNVEEIVAVPQDSLVTISYTDTTGKCQIESTAPGTADSLPAAAAAVLAGMQNSGTVRTSFDTAVLEELGGSASVPTPPYATGTPAPTPSVPDLTGDITSDLPTADPGATPGADATPTPTQPAGEKIIENSGDSTCTHEYAKDARQSKEATCVSEGVEYYKCSRCSAAYFIKIPKNENHSFNSGVHTAGTDCTTKGYTSYTCSVCGEVKKVEDSTAPGHTYDSGRHTDGDCQNYGYTTYTCTRCGATKTENDSQKGSHKFQPVHTEGSCIDKGYTIPVCTVCGEKDTDHMVIDENYGPHSYGEDHKCKYCMETEPGY